MCAHCVWHRDVSRMGYTGQRVNSRHFDDGSSNSSVRKHHPYYVFDLARQLFASARRDEMMNFSDDCFFVPIMRRALQRLPRRLCATRLIAPLLLARPPLAHPRRLFSQPSTPLPATTMSSLELPELLEESSELEEPDESEEVDDIFASASSTFKLRPYQEECVQACLDALAGGLGRIGVSSPTGTFDHFPTTFCASRAVYRSASGWM